MMMNNGLTEQQNIVKLSMMKNGMLAYSIRVHSRERIYVTFMARIRKQCKGKTSGYLIRFNIGDKERSFYLGKRYTERQANKVCEIVGYLEKAINNPDDTLPKWVSEWITETKQEIRDKLTDAGLIRRPKRHTTGELWETFLKAKIDVTQSTLDIYDHTERRFFAFFDRNIALNELNFAAMEQWKTYLRTDYKSPVDGKPLSEATTALTLVKTRAVFNYGIKLDWLEANPMKGLNVGSFENEANNRPITIPEYYRLLAVCPCRDWRVIIALARIGGLRCPSEALLLRWDDIDWLGDNGTFLVHATKTKRHKGKGERHVPLFPELREELQRLFDEGPKSEFVISRYRAPSQNLGTQFARIAKLAGLTKIPRPFDNMRASRSNEIYAKYGAFYESAWIGHSAKVATDHYLWVSDENVKRAGIERTGSYVPATPTLPPDIFSSQPEPFSSQQD